MEKVYVVPVQDNCNCNCTFCISKTRGYNKHPSIMQMDDCFFRSLETLKSLNIKKVEITGGGEPTIHKDLQVIINYLRDYLKGCYIKLYTNGRLEVPIQNVDEINISMAHIDDDINKQIMRYNDSKKALEIIKFYKQYTDRLRLSIPIISGAIDSTKKMNALIASTKQYITEYVVRTLYDGTLDIEKNYADFDINNPIVRMEKDNCLCDFKDRLIMWSDNHLYTNWDLGEEYSAIKMRCYK
jgi:molybdenum cofactor biosynthesis enzyme MoaA